MQALLVLLIAAFEFVAVPMIVFICFCLPKRRSLLLWGPVPIINNKYWSEAVKGLGYESQTLVSNYYAINQKSDFDVYLNELAEFQKSLGRLGNYLGRLLGLAYVLRRAKVLHIPFSGGVLGNTRLWRLEASIYKLFKIKTVVIPYGADAHVYSQIQNTSAHNALLIDYPLAARREAEITRRVHYWARHADCVITGAIIYGMPRWDVVTPSPLSLDMAAVQAKREYSNTDGRNGKVIIIHSPNHQGFKGTEFLLEAIKTLQREGLRVELRLLEKMKNSEVLQAMQTADILAEQFIAGGYALNAIEGMASGLAVMSNLEDQNRSVLFRRYSFLNECPILSTTPETLLRDLKTLVTNPALREELGRAGRSYAEKYHSYESARYLFGAVYDRILHGKQVDLMNLFHPLKSEYNKKGGPIVTSLVENKLPHGSKDRC